MTVDVFVCTRNRSSALRNTLRSVLRNNCENHKVNIYVCDNGSDDDTNLVMNDVEFSHVHKFHQPNPGKSRCLNRMIAASRGEYLLFTDDDVLVPHDWIQRMVSRAIDCKSDAIVGGVDIAGEVIPLRWTDKHLAYFASTRHVPVNDDHPFIGANYLVTRNVFNMVGGFNPLVGPGGIGHAEDTLFWLQCRKMQAKIIQARDIQVLHYPDVRRMTDSGIIGMAKKQGEFEAYVDYHWEHYKRPHVALSYVMRSIKLLKVQIKYIGTKSNPESILELALAIKKFYSVRHYISYQSDNLHYSKPQGTQHDYTIVGNPMV
jgi:glycosyltransferase involved in cell wall biosynthesis